MKALVERLGTKVKGILQGFDRLVFKGFIRPLMYPEGAMRFCRSQGILNKEYKAWMLQQTERVIRDAETFVQQTCGQPLRPLATYKIRKEELAHEQQHKRQINSGLIGGWSCQEFGRSYRAGYDARAGYPQLHPYAVRCKHLYLYFDHADYGFMSLRLQTWFPYQIQIALNGREWLRRALEKEGLDAVIRGNKIYQVSDIQRAQQLLTAQRDTSWVELLDGLIPLIFPGMNEIVGPNSYTWTLWQSEWATDLLLPVDVFGELVEPLLRHAWLTGSSRRVLRYMGHAQGKTGWPRANSKPTLMSRCQPFYDGLCIRHRLNQNSVKIYNEQYKQSGVVRLEVTMNNPGAFRVHRHKQGQSKDHPKNYLPLRQGVADVALRAEVANQITDRFSDQLSSFSEHQPVQKLIEQVTRRHVREGRNVRALDLFGKDRKLLLDISDPAFCVSGMTNKLLREKMKNDSWMKGRTDRQCSAKVGRQLRLLRDHGLIRKVKGQNRYLLTEKGQRITSALAAALVASVDELIKIAA